MCQTPWDEPPHHLEPSDLPAQLFRFSCRVAYGKSSEPALKGERRS